MSPAPLDDYDNMMKDSIMMDNALSQYFAASARQKQRMYAAYLQEKQKNQQLENKIQQLEAPKQQKEPYTAQNVTINNIFSADKVAFGDNVNTKINHEDE